MVSPVEVPPLPLTARVERGASATRIALAIGGGELWLVRGSRGAHLSARDVRMAPAIVDALLAWLGAPAAARPAGTLHAVPFELDDRVDRDDPVSLGTMRLDIRFIDGVVPLELELDEAAGTARLTLLDRAARDRLIDYLPRILTSAEPARLDGLAQLALPPLLSAPIAATPGGVLAIACNHTAGAAMWRWAGPPEPPARIGDLRLAGYVHAAAPGPGADEVTVFAVHAENPGSWAPTDPCSIVVVDVVAGTTRTVVDRRSHIWYEPGLRWSPDGRLAIAVSYEVPGTPSRRLRAAIDVLDGTGAVIATSPGYVQIKRPRWVDGKLLCSLAGSGEVRPEHVTWDPATNAVVPAPAFTERSYAGHSVISDETGIKVGPAATPVAGLLHRHDTTTPATWLDATTCVILATVAAAAASPPRLVAIDATTGAWTPAVRHGHDCTAVALTTAAVISDRDHRLWWAAL